jgi:hypothetical protein
MTTLKDLWRLGAPSAREHEWPRVAPTPSRRPRWAFAALGGAVAAAAVLWVGLHEAPRRELLELDLHVTGTPQHDRTVIVLTTEKKS